MGELKDALLHTAPEPGGENVVVLDEREVDEVLGGFVGKRAFGAKREMRGGAGSRGSGGRGEVFRYREWVGGLTGGGGGGGGEDNKKDNGEK